MEEVNCDYCGSNKYEYVSIQTDIIHKSTNKKFQIVRCQYCGLQFENPRPTVDEIGQYYSSEYSFHAKKSFIKTKLLTASDWLANSSIYYLIGLIPYLANRLVPYVKPQIDDPVMIHYRKGRILDIGCGSGDSAHFWGESGALSTYKRFAEVHGLEVSDTARKQLNAKGIPTYKELSDVPKSLQFDIIRMNWSLEHVHSPSEYFKFLKERLTDEGRAIITVPNYNGLLYRIAADCVELPIHLYHFRPEDIRNYSEKYKLVVESLDTFSYPEMFLYAARIHDKLAKCFGFNMSLIEARHFQEFLSRFDRGELGNDMIAILKKRNNLKN